MSLDSMLCKLRGIARDIASDVTLVTYSALSKLQFHIIAKSTSAVLAHPSGTVYYCRTTSC